MIKLFFTLLLLFTFLPSKEITIYVNNHYSNSDLTYEQWGPTIEHLQKKLPQHHFNFLPINPKEVKKIQDNLENKNIDFLITQPIIYSHLRFTHGVQRLLTLENKHGMTQFGSVFITHKESSIKTLEDIEGKTIAAVAPLGFGGWLIGYSQLYDRGIDPLKDKKVSFLGSHKKIALAVSNKEYDLGVIRTGMWESLIHKKILDGSKLRIINELPSPYPLKTSTKLYPEWVFAVANHVDNSIAKEVFKAVVNIKSDDKAAIKGKYSTWVIPEDYTDVDALLKKFHLAQYYDMSGYQLKDFMTIIATLIIAFVLLIFYFRYRFLVHAEKLQKIKIKEITREIEAKDKILLMQSRHAAMGEMLSMIAHQWRQPLCSLSLILQKLILFKNRDQLSAEKVQSNVDKSMEIINTLSNTINDFTHYFKVTTSRDTFMVSDIIHKALNIIEVSLKDNNITIHENLDKTLQVRSAQSDLLQVLLNLLQNAKESLIEKQTPSASISLVTFLKNNRVYITVSDNGGDIDTFISSKFFTPYFSTKNKNGTGLGLYMSKTIIEEQLHGELNFANSDGLVSFTIILPQNSEIVSD